MWWRGTESNCRHYDFQSYALPTELPRHVRKSALRRNPDNITRERSAEAWQRAAEASRTGGLTRRERPRSNSSHLSFIRSRQNVD